VTGEVETEEGVLVIRRIHVAMRLVAPEPVKETVERVHGLYPMRCPLYRTLHKAIQLTSSFTLAPPEAEVDAAEFLRGWLMHWLARLEQAPNGQRHHFNSSEGGS